MPNERNKDLLDPAIAVSSYFDSLLQPEQEQAGVPTELAEREQNAPTVIYMPVLEADLARLDVQTEKKAKATQTSVETAQRDYSPKADTRVEQAVEQSEPISSAAAQPVSSGYEFPMQCLMFSVAGYNFSLPLIEMGSVLNWSDNLTSLPGTPPWFLGLLKHRERNIRVVDTARLLRLERGKQHQGQGIQNILVFGESDWAITCDRMGEVLRLEEPDIQWKEATHKSLSLGTIRSSLALLLDPARLLAYLNGVELPAARKAAPDK